MPKINVEQERTTQLLNEAAERTDDDPLVMIAWYDELIPQDKARFLTGLAEWQGRLQFENYAVLRISHIMMGVLHRGVIAERGDNGNT